MNGTHILVTGNLATGFEFIGPVTPNDPILDHHIDTQLHGADWVYVDVKPLADVVVPDAPDDQQPGTHRVTVELKWSETISYEEQVEIDVPDGYEGDLIDLIDVDNNPFDDGDIDGVPEGYESHWLDRASFDSVVDTTDREISEVYAVDPES